MPTVDLTLQEIEVETILVSLGFMDNVQAGVKPYGRGLTFTFDITAGIAYGATFPIAAGVVAPFTADVIEPVCAHVGQGVVLFGFDHPQPELVARYELFYAANLTGAYAIFNSGIFRQRRGMVRNVPLNVPAYFQITAVGKNGARSNPVQVKQGRIVIPTLVNLKIRGIAGSTIPQNAMFSSLDTETGMTVLMRAKQNIILQ